MLYRIRKKNEVNPLDPETLEHLHATSLFGPRKTSPFSLFAEFYCDNNRCAIRTVVVRASYPHRDRPEHPCFNCPGCGKLMIMDGHLKDIFLEPVPEEQE